MIRLFSFLLLQLVLADEQLIHVLPTEDYIIFSFVSIGLVLFAGMMSGLTVGMMGIDELDLEMKLASGTEIERQQARKVLPIINQHHLLLVTLLVANAAAMETLPIFLDEMFSSIIAVVLSVTFVLAFGEVLPQALCTGPDQLKIASKLVPIVKFVMVIFFPVSYPIAKLLDKIFGHGHSKKLKNDDLKALVRIHETYSVGPADKTGLGAGQIKIIHGAIDSHKEIVKNHMINFEKVFMLSTETVLSKSTFQMIMAQGYSRVPIYRGNNKVDIVGILLVKKLIGSKEGNTIEGSGIKLRETVYINPNFTILDLLEIFQEGKSHMAIVSDSPESVPSAEKNVLGIITLEDVLEQILKADILDEADYDRLSRIFSTNPNNQPQQQNSTIGKKKPPLKKPEDYHKLEG
ncbi:unnamed protein product [Blepharisma stoltei]|uniref:CNNM transmembrane domain-containing protein n=1 Tax=Blepharisma stoltei TaxID=1481888 RepID=A0AAU9KIK4_9CILI|nr:unnamed protein product [Blepharisma stoltei]